MYIIWRSYWSYAVRNSDGILGMATDYIMAAQMCRAFGEDIKPHISKA